MFKFTILEVLNIEHLRVQLCIKLHFIFNLLNSAAHLCVLLRMTKVLDPMT